MPAEGTAWFQTRRPMLAPPDRCPTTPRLKPSASDDVRAIDPERVEEHSQVIDPVPDVPVEVRRG
jgi:hypothetical protein